MIWVDPSMRVMLMGGPHSGGVVQRAYASIPALSEREYLIEVGDARAGYRIVTLFDLPDGSHAAFAHEVGCGCSNAVCVLFRDRVR